MPYIKFQLTPIWQPNIFLPLLRITSKILPQQLGRLSLHADDKKMKADDIFLNMLITTDDLSKSDQVPPDRVDILCKHVTDDLVDTD
jgi:hypothetical protein